MTFSLLAAGLWGGGDGSRRRGGGDGSRRRGGGDAWRAGGLFAGAAGARNREISLKASVVVRTFLSKIGSSLE